MGLRLLSTVSKGTKSAKIYRDAEWNEYRVKFFQDGVYQTEADSHHDDNQDAEDTATFWINM